MKLMLRVTLALVAGLLLGLAVAAGHLTFLPAILDPVGTIFVDAIRLAVIPLVTSGLIVGTAAPANRAAVAGLSRRTAVIVLGTLFAAVVFSEAVSLPVFAHLHVAAGTLAAASPEKQATPSMTQWFIDLVPANPFKAAADGAMLPLIVASIGFGLALSRVEAQQRDAVVRFFHGISDASLVFVGWVVQLAPIGVFALATLLTARIGTEAIRALVFYIAAFIGICWGFILLVLYPAATLLGRRSLAAFVRAALPAQTVGFASRSSMAALPTAYEGARNGLAIGEESYRFFLPIAASIFRVGAAIAQIVGVIFLARLYGVALTSGQLASMLFIVVATSMTAPGIPGGSILVIAPVLAAANIPVAGIALLLGADTVPDMFRTAANVTGWIVALSILEPTRAKDSSR